VLAAWVPPTERARAVSLTTSGMYLGSAAAMLVLPGLAAAAGPAALLRLVGGLGLAWLALWRLTLARVRGAAAAAAMPLHDGEGERKGHAPRGRGGAATPWRAMLAHRAGGLAAAAASPTPLGMCRSCRSAPAVPSLRACGACLLTPPPPPANIHAVWAILVCNFTFHYAFYVIMNWLPTYFEQARARHCGGASLYLYGVGLGGGKGLTTGPLGVASNKCMGAPPHHTTKTGALQYTPTPYHHVPPRLLATGAARQPG
jgi:ACS family sodium-dependent inorganic phosphate cotransporter